MKSVFVRVLVLVSYLLFLISSLVHKESDDDVEGGRCSMPISVGSINKGKYIIISGRPCKVIDYSTSKQGKHGKTIANIVGIDIFTNKKFS